MARTAPNRASRRGAKEKPTAVERVGAQPTAKRPHNARAHDDHDHDQDDDHSDSDRDGAATPDASSPDPAQPLPPKRRKTAGASTAETSGPRRGRGRPPKKKRSRAVGDEEETEWEVEAVLGMRRAADWTEDAPRFQYAVKWAGSAGGESSWWTPESLQNDRLVLQAMSSRLARGELWFEREPQPEDEAEGSLVEPGPVSGPLSDPGLEPEPESEPESEASGAGYKSAESTVGADAGETSDRVRRRDRVAVENGGADEQAGGDDDVPQD